MSRPSLLHRVPAVVALALVWVALWRGFTVGLVLSGLVVGAVIVVVLGPSGLRGSATVRPLPALRYLGRFLRDLAVASATVSWEVVTPKSRVRTGIVAVPVSGGSDVVTTIVANTISLVPGTLTIEARRDPPVLYVHVLHLDDPERVRAEVRRLEELAIRAFGDRDAVAALADASPGPAGSPSSRPPEEPS